MPNPQNEARHFNVPPGSIESGLGQINLYGNGWEAASSNLDSATCYCHWVFLYSLPQFAKGNAGRVPQIRPRKFLPNHFLFMISRLTVTKTRVWISNWMFNNLQVVTTINYYTVTDFHITKHSTLHSTTRYGFITQEL
jgi:hypothetical protein